MGSWIYLVKNFFSEYTFTWARYSIPIGVVFSKIIFILLSIAFFTLLERKVMSSIQRRRGPNILGFFGVLQPFADGIKLLLKELSITSNTTIFIYFLAPILTFSFTIPIWFLIPMDGYYTMLDLPFTILLVLAISTLSVHGILFAGWSSNSKYAFLGGIRSASQMISYELCLSTIYLCVSIISGGFSWYDIVYAQRNVWFIFPLLPLFVVFLISALAETNRTPFDLPEAEAELVAGYNVEYSAIAFASFFSAEYGNMLIMCCLTTILFLGGWSWTVFSFLSPILIFSIKVCFFMFFYIWIRAAVPRYRYDQLMSIGWRVLLPVTFFLFFLSISIFVGLSMFI